MHLEMALTVNNAPRTCVRSGGLLYNNLEKWLFLCSGLEFFQKFFQRFNRFEILADSIFWIFSTTNYPGYLRYAYTNEAVASFTNYDSPPVAYAFSHHGHRPKTPQPLSCSNTWIDYECLNFVILRLINIIWIRH